MSERIQRQGGALRPSDFIGLGAIIALVAAFGVINPRFLGLNNISNILGDVSTLLILATGMTFVLLVGSIDLSVGATASCATVLFVMTLPRLGAVSFLLTIAYGATAGLISGFVFARLKVPSFIATFGTMSIYKSLAMLIAGGASQQIGKAYYPYIDWYQISLGFLPLPFIVAALLMLVMALVLSKTIFGKTVLAVGGNELAARAAGLEVNLTKMAVFTLTGLFAAIGGIMFACKLKSGIPTIGDPFATQTIAAVALGGTSMSGGKGGLFKTLAGVVLIILIQNGMNVIGISAFWQQTTFGSIILAAVFLTSDRKRRMLIVK